MAVITQDEPFHALQKVIDVVDVRVDQPKAQDMNLGAS